MVIISPKNKKIKNEEKPQGHGSHGGAGVAMYGWVFSLGEPYTTLVQYRQCSPTFGSLYVYIQSHSSMLALSPHPPFLISNIHLPFPCATPHKLSWNQRLLKHRAACPTSAPSLMAQFSRGLLSSAGSSSSGFSSFFFTSRTFSNRLIRRLPRVTSSSGSSSFPSSWIPGGGQGRRECHLSVCYSYA